jgi:predicted GNAT family acetyltransferase
MDRISLSKKNIRLGYFKPEEANNDYGCEYVHVKRCYHLGIDIWMDSTSDTSTIEVEFVCMYTNKRIMEMTLSKVNRKSKAYHVDITKMDSKYQGKGLAPKLYRQLLKSTGIILKAGECQSAGGRYVWNVMAGYHDLTVYGKLRYGQWELMEPNPDTREVEFEYVKGGDMTAYDGRDFHMYCTA